MDNDKLKQAIDEFKDNLDYLAFNNPALFVGNGAENTEELRRAFNSLNMLKEAAEYWYQLKNLPQYGSVRLGVDNLVGGQEWEAQVFPDHWFTDETPEKLFDQIKEEK